MSALYSRIMDLTLCVQNLRQVSQQNTSLLRDLSSQLQLIAQQRFDNVLQAPAPISKTMDSRFKGITVKFSANEASASRVSKMLMHSTKFDTFNGEDMGLFTRWVNKLLSGFRLSQPTEAQACLITMHHLTGRAAELAIDIPNRVSMQDLNELLLELDKNFNASATEEVAKNLLAHFVQKEDMSIQDYALGLEQLYGRAYPFDSFHVSVFLKDRFISGLVSREIQTKLRTPPLPKDYREAVNTAMALAAAHYPEHQIFRQKAALWKMGTTMKHPLIGKTTFDSVKNPGVMSVESQLIEDVNAIKAWCSIHKSDKHSNSECRAQKSSKKSRKKRKTKGRTIRFKTSKGKRKFVRSMLNTDELELSDGTSQSSGSDDESADETSEPLAIEQLSCQQPEESSEKILIMESNFSENLDFESALIDSNFLRTPSPTLHELLMVDPLVVTSTRDETPIVDKIASKPSSGKPKTIKRRSRRSRSPSTSGVSTEVSDSSETLSSKRFKDNEENFKVPRKPSLTLPQILEGDAKFQFRVNSVFKPRRHFSVYVKRTLFDEDNEILNDAFEGIEKPHPLPICDDAVESETSGEDSNADYSDTHIRYSYDANIDDDDLRSFTTMVFMADPKIWDLHKIRDQMGKFYCTYFCVNQLEKEWKKRAKKRIKNFNYKVTRELNKIPMMHQTPMWERRRILECKTRNLFQSLFDLLEFSQTFDDSQYTQNLYSDTLLPGFKTISDLFLKDPCHSCPVPSNPRAQFSQILYPLSRMPEAEFKNISARLTNSILVKTQPQLHGSHLDPYNLGFLARDKDAFARLSPELQIQFTTEMRNLVEINSSHRVHRGSAFHNLSPILRENLSEERLQEIIALRKFNLMIIIRSLLSRYKNRQEKLLQPFGTTDVNIPPHDK